MRDPISSPAISAIGRSGCCSGLGGALLRQSLEAARLIQVRRMIGVAAFCYVLAHFVFFALDKSLQIAVVAREIALPTT
jgi:DMSO/TMAO reductase YedYZ heme-binding membrane subunit